MSPAAARGMLKLSSVLSDQGLESWSHVSEDTKQYLSQVPWIREKVQGHDKDAQDIQGAGVWSTSSSPESTHADPQSDAGSINLDAGIPEFSLRRTDSNGPAKKPIGEVLDEVRDKLKSIKEIMRAQRSATFPGVGSLELESQTGFEGSFANSARVQPWAAPPETMPSRIVAPKILPTANHSPTISEGQTKAHQTQQKSQHSRNRLSQFSVLRHRDSQNSIDSHLLEIQLFPGEIATDANKEEIKQRLPTSIRAQCTYKDGYWWYDGDPGDLSGLNKDGNSERARAGIGDPSKGSQPIIQKGNITIAGRPLLIERCFRKHKEAWTCEPDVNIMKDTPIPLYKDGETVVVHPQPIAKPSKFKWKDEDPIKRAIDPSKYSPTDLLDIANVVWPHEFCLWLDGTLQVVLNKKELKGRTMSFPRKIGGLNVSFSDAIASSTQPQPPRFRFSEVDSTSVTSLRSLKSKSTFRDSKSSHPMYKSDAEDSARSPRSASTNGKAIGPANGLLKEDKANIQNSSSRPSAHSKQASAQHLQDKDINLAAASSKTLNGSAKLPGPLVDKTLRDHRATKPHNPCEVVVGETFEHGASCFVGVKIRDDAGNVMITIPTSAALEAACKARKDHSVFPRIMDHVKHPLGKQVIDVVGLPVWTKADPHHKIGTVARCFDTEKGSSLNKHSRHPDDLLYDICLVNPEADNSFANITSPSQQWWTKVNETEPSQIVQNTRLHIVCPPANNIRDAAYAVDGKEQRKFAFSLPDEPSNAAYQGLRVIPRRGPRVKTTHGVRKVPPLVLQTSTLYRFLGPVESWERFRGAAVVEVGDRGKWESVVGLHSFEYLSGLGNDASPMTWSRIEKEMLEGILSFWGCRHLPEELTRMELCD